MRAIILLVLSSFLAATLHAFNPTLVVLQHQRRHHYSSRSSAVLHLQATDANDDDKLCKDTLDTTSTSCRRSFLVGASGAAAVAVLSLQPALAEDIKKQPVCVIGCNGKTGTEVVKYLVAKNMPVRASSRTGDYNDAESIPTKAAFEKMTCDVTDPSAVKLACAGTRAVIFAASASKQGGTPSAIDNAGLVNVAKACIEANVPHLVVVSSGAVTKPASPVYQFLNLFGKIMEEKIKGEDAVRKLYAENNSNLTYTIIRPGGLTLDPARGAGAIELNQGDTKSGRLARADVAALCVESLAFPEVTGGTTFECYDADTGAPLATVGLSNIAKKKTDGDVFISGFERRGDTYKDIFTGLKKDA